MCIRDRRQWQSRTKLIFVAAAVAILAVLAALSWHSKESRWKIMVSDVNRYEQHDRDTSVGIRIQLWKASWMMFKESPLVGVGVPNFRPELVKLQKQGVVLSLIHI